MRLNRPRVRVSLTLLTTCALLLSSAARASLVVALDLPTMVERADHIAVVDVMSTSSAWDASHETILTTTELSVVETWKGSMTPAMKVKIVQPGGTVGDVTMKVFGMSSFAPGERALVFLRGTSSGASVVGMAQGKRLVRRDVTSQKWMVQVPDQAGASFVRLKTPTTSSTPAPATSPTKSSTPSSLSPTGETSTPPVFERGPRALDDVRLQVRDLVRVKAQTR
jgi:hypothetical protein